MIDQRLLDLLLKSNLQHTQRFNELMLKDEVLGKLSDKQIAIAALIYAAGMANLTQLKIEDFITLATYAYQNVDVTEPTEEKTGNA